LFRHYYALPSARDSDGREVALSEESLPKTFIDLSDVPYEDRFFDLFAIGSSDLPVGCPRRESKANSQSRSSSKLTSVITSRTPSAVKSCWILCSGPPRSIDSVGTSNPATNTTLDGGMSNRLE